MAAETPSPAVIQGSVPNAGGPNSLGPTPFENASDPVSPPWATIPVPEHVSTSAWQQSYYDPTSGADASVFRKLPSGPCDLQTGRFTDASATAPGGFHPGHKFRQT